MFVAGIHVPGNHYVRKVKDRLTDEPDDLIRAIHEKAMPVLLLQKEESETWMRPPLSEATGRVPPLAIDAHFILSRKPYGASIVSKSGAPSSSPQPTERSVFRNGSLRWWKMMVSSLFVPIAKSTPDVPEAP